MNIRMKNRHFPYTIEFLDKLQLTGKVSRARRKLIQKMQGKFKEIQEDYQAAFNAESEDEKVIGIEDERQKKKEEVEFLDEIAVINLSEYQDQILLLAQSLDNYPHELSGADAEMHDLLLDQLEEAINHG